MKNIQDEFYPAALTISGSDPCGGSGIQTDLRTFNAAGVYGCSVITAVTAQNPRQLFGVEAVSLELVTKQLDAVLNTVALKAVKCGMIPNGKMVGAIAKSLKKCHAPLVVDPVLFIGNEQLLDEDGINALKKELLPLAKLITPDVAAAEVLLGRKLRKQAEVVKAAGELAEAYKCNVVLKNNNSSNGGVVSDIAVINGKSHFLTYPRVNDLAEYAGHGSKCTFSSAVTAMLAVGNNWKDALRNAQAYLYGSLSETALIGKELEAMYPPLEDYSAQVRLVPAEKNQDFRAGEKR